MIWSDLYFKSITMEAMLRVIDGRKVKVEAESPLGKLL